MTTTQLLRASSAAKWYNCPGSVHAEQGRPDGDTSAADEGTVAHWIAAKVLRSEPLPSFGTKWVVVEKQVMPAIADTGDEPVITYTEEMLEHVMTYVNAAKTYGEIHAVEVPVKIAVATGEDEAEGTPDLATLLYGEEVVLAIHDLKYGYNPVAAKDNLQLAIYAGAIITELRKQPLGFPVLAKVILVIHQPRLGIVDEQVYAQHEILALVNNIYVRSQITRSHPEQRKAGEHCFKHYCKARAVCGEFAKYTQASYRADLNELPDMSDVDIGVKLAAIPAITAWCKAVEEEAKHKALELGEKIQGYKVVEGKRGNREWQSAAEAEEVMKAMKLKHEVMYDKSLISPTTAEKQFKAGNIGPRNWPKIEALITRKASKNQLVPESDKRPAVEVLPVLDELPMLTDDDFSDLV